MFQLMRTIHLGLGLIFVPMALVFIASSLAFIYRPWLPAGVKEAELSVSVSDAAAASPRAAARELMANYGLKGDLRQIQREGDNVRFRIVRPGESAEVEYARSSGKGKIKVRRLGAFETLMQLHTNHGLWHDFLPSNAWAAISLLTSIGLLLLGATGIYLWFSHYSERLIGGVLLGAGLLFSIVTLVVTRLDQ